MDKLYVVVPDENGQLHANVWDGKFWGWDPNPLGVLPNNTRVVGSPSVISYTLNGILKLYIFVTGSDGHLYVAIWDTKRWQWVDFGTPPGQRVGSGPSAIACVFSQTNQDNLYVFVMGDQGNLAVLTWDGNKHNWTWRDLKSGKVVLVIPG
jgi:hypothetical protein